MAAPPNDSPSGLRRSAWPSSSVARSSSGSVAALRGPARGRGGPAPRPSSSSWLMRSAEARRSWTSSSTAGSRIASARAASSVRPSSRSPVRRRTANASSRVASRIAPVGRRRDDRAAPARRGGAPPRGRWRRGRPRPRRSRSGRAGGVAGRESVLGEHRQAGRGRVAAVQQQVDDGGVDLAAPRRRQLARRELADLLVGERVVRGLALGLLEEETGGDRRREFVGRAVVLAGRPAAPGSPAGRGG